MKRRLPTRSPFVLLVIALALAGYAVLRPVAVEPVGAFQTARRSQPHGISRAQPAILPSKNEGDPTAGYQHLYDHFEEGDVLLFSKGESEMESRGDLWFRDATGKERFVAPSVTGAKFSPDGTRIAYATSGPEVFVETLEGKQLARIPRASDPKWSADGNSVNFSAMADPDYPEMQQPAVYELDANPAEEPKLAN